MTQKTIQGNADLAKQIRLGRSELGLTIGKPPPERE